MAKAKIMVVEDEGIVAKDIQNTLKRLGYAVPATASSGEEAIKKAAEVQPDLILMDIVLKGKMNGIEATGQVRANLDIPVIYLTAYADDLTLERAKVTEPFGYILKPFDERELYTNIEMALYKHKMERKLRESEQWLAAERERLDVTLHSIGDGVIATDTEGKIVLINPVAENLTGWPREEAIGRSLAEVFHIINEQTRRRCENPVGKVLETGGVVGLANHTVIIARDGTERILADSGAPIRDKDGNILGVVLVFQDITERRRMEQDILNAKIQRLESLGILAGGLAHDFNNILTAILGNISLAKIYAKPEDKVFKKLIEAERASFRAKDLTQQLLTFAKGGAPIKKTTAILELLMETVEFALSGSNVNSRFSIPDDIRPVECDPGQIGQVISNLVINAREAMPEGGIIEVKVEKITVGARSSVSLQAGEYIKISIQDHGVGIPEKYLQRIFDPYFTTKQRGSGLGLAAGFSIIRNHEGYIEAESELGVGTTFSIYLPASKERLKIRKDESVKLLRGEGRILLMDDDEDVLESTGALIRNFGYEVDFARDGAQAIGMYQKGKESGQPFDAVILDLTIPGGMGGKEAMVKLLEIDPEIKAIVFSGYSNDPVMAEFQKYGFRGMVAKPFGIQDLGEILQKVISGR